MPFSTLGLSEPLLKALADLKYSEPTAIQKKAIPVILSGKNLVAAAQTGTGKTASFVLPILEKLNTERKLRGKRIRALILTPTRELAVQVEQSIRDYGKYLDLSSMAMYGGTDIEPQRQKLIWGVDIVVATPGRLLDMAHQRALHFDELEVLVLDEADRMLDMGFIEDINKIIERLPLERQNLLFSATISDDVRTLSKRTFSNATEISIGNNSASKPKIDQWLITVDKGNKSALLSHLIIEHQWQQALIFIETKHGAAKLVSQLEKRGISAESIHGGRTQAMREQVLNDFKAGKIKFLVATGIASRGLDIGELTRVVNYDLPDQVDDYIHRIGRTGRAGASGEAVSFVAKDNFRNLCAIESRLGHVIKRKEFEGFPVKKVVPLSILNYVPKNKR
ncbi:MULTISPECIES: DEAD/DEAH box helicase [unclassified Colwellia]|jgi:ATP-dependent RNA helicase RhlE|uniref:DEAD/DEAH box helicase n=1 Tax=unclassified Colwellia TaxID=196834 RepID=UPI0015F40A0A|nr:MULTISPECIES: DEAD/DEAH box helicase [unclassified Colwellia]MBA6347286.1 DEAD/DEAH box helicase [Colwellia sp. BRX8-9]MBA6378290.1 DEAD/DEAH box helicase [Colwellia sp. BRX10-7]MBA6386261.1 DEAD/DEAH box helicase [Colwellia sp. BRX10-2]MBA6403540.1 DEAD/DEAH box helicase [Colwellia sp. BRX10-5]MBA6405085.1 DEAD/DEAH box helicase [Colwellia sp. BRX10-1]